MTAPASRLEQLNSNKDIKPERVGIWNTEVNKALNNGMLVKTLGEIKREKTVKPIVESIAIVK